MTSDLGDKTLPLGTKVIYCMPTISTLPIIVLLAAYGNSLYELCGADLAMISACIAAARSMDVVTDPAMSYITDCFKSRFGRRRPFMASGCLFYGLSLVALLTPPHGSSLFVGFWFGLFYVVFFLTNTYCNIPYDALGPELTDNYEDRSRLFFISGILDGLGTFIAVALPVLMAMVAKGLSINDELCRPGGSSDNLDSFCQRGMTCDDYVTDSSRPFVSDPGYNASGILWLGGQTIAFLNAGCSEPVNIQVFYAALDAPHVLYCECRRDCTATCHLANKRTGFTLVGIVFGVWYVCTIALLVWRIQERSQVEKKVFAKAPASLKRSSSSLAPLEAAGRPRTPPLVPMLLSTMTNQAFTVLLPAWCCDGMVNAVFAALITYYIRYVIQPEYQTMEENGRDCAKGVNALSTSDNFSHWCSTESVLAGCLCCALFCAMAATPVWLLLVRLIGKVRTWLLWSLVMAATNILFVFPGKGDIVMCALICGLNGLPIAAKFLADAVLADIIDYDEFLTGSRREATYTMFKSFLPKIMAIPSMAIPISLLSMVGHRPPVNGMIQEQPAAVPFFIKAIGAVLTAAVSMVAWAVKMCFPLKTRQQVDMVAEGISMHLVGAPAPDPLSGVSFAITAFEDDELEHVWSLDHFVGSSFISRLLLDIEAGVALTLKHARGNFVASSVTFFVALVIAVVMVGPLNLMSKDDWSFLPTLTIVFLGADGVAMAFFHQRVSAARKLEQNPPSEALLKKVLKQRVDLESLTAPRRSDSSDSLGKPTWLGRSYLQYVDKE